MPEEFTDVELSAYLEEMLPVSRTVEIEAALRSSTALRDRLSRILHEVDAGGVSIGEVWRRLRLSCLTRSQIGEYLLGVLDPAWREYFEFHLHTVGCRLCEANLQDLQQSQRQESQQAETRRRRFFESSAGRMSLHGP